MRLYDPTPTREKTSLRGEWSFLLDPEDAGREAGHPDGLPGSALLTWVPSCWNTRAGLRDYRGTVWYEKTFPGTAGKLALLRFGAVCYYAQVWLNGRELGSHAGGFSPFWFLVELRQQNRLVVRVDNRWGEWISPGMHESSIDWQMYGGITRDVWVEEVPPVFIEDVRIVASAQGSLKASVALINRSVEPARVPVALNASEERLTRTETELDGNERKTLELEAKVESPVLWNIGTPCLYQISVTAGPDELRARIGFREVSAAGTALKVNGGEVFLRGINRHDDHPDWGHSIPASLLLKDIELVRQMGCNAIRGVHYPPDELILDLCDEYGIGFLEEVPAYQLSTGQLEEEQTKLAIKQMVGEMIGRDFNHPCVLAWGILNEAETQTESTRARITIKELADHVHRLDATRPVMYCSAAGTDDKYFDLVDVVCINEYLGWYRGEPRDVPALLKKSRALYPGKPILVTEFGAGAIEGFHSADAVKWSEEGQERFLRDTLKILLGSEELSGCFVWQMADVDVVVERAVQRPRTKNNKGILTGHRDPKLSFWTVKRLYGERMKDE